MATSLHPLAVGVISLYAGYHYFQRQPRRTIPQGPGEIVAPAAGKVIYIERVENQTVAFFKNDVLNVLNIADMAPPFQVVVIQLDLFDVHVQRAPIAGSVVAQQYYPGSFANAVYGPDRAHLVNANEKLLTVIRSATTEVAVIQVAGMLARRIERFVQPAALLQKGQPIGRITFGSQVVLVLRDEARLTVRLGQQLTDGETIVATTTNS